MHRVVDEYGITHHTGTYDSCVAYIRNANAIFGYLHEWEILPPKRKPAKRKG